MWKTLWRAWMQRAINGGAADSLVFALRECDKIVSAQMPFLAEEHVDDEIALTRPFGAGRSETIEIRQRSGHGEILRPSACLPRPKSRC